MKVEFRGEALSELEFAARFYETCRPGLGSQFIDAVRRAINRIAESPRAWAEIDLGFRRCRLNEFPYGVIYALEPAAVLILAIAHLGRKPGYWKSRR